MSLQVTRPYSVASSASAQRQGLRAVAQTLYMSQHSRLRIRSLRCHTAMQIWSTNLCRGPTPSKTQTLNWEASGPRLRCNALNFIDAALNVHLKYFAFRARPQTPLLNAGVVP